MESIRISVESTERDERKIGTKAVETRGWKGQKEEKQRQSEIKSRQKKALDMIRGGVDPSGCYRRGIPTRKREAGNREGGNY